MRVDTVAGIQMRGDIPAEYFKRLVNKFFKILPMREHNEDSLATYMQSLQVELLGCQDLIVDLKSDAEYMMILSVLQHLIEHPEYEVSYVKREVFRMISTCNKLQARFAERAVMK